MVVNAVAQIAILLLYAILKASIIKIFEALWPIFADTSNNELNKNQSAITYFHFH